MTDYASLKIVQDTISRTLDTDFKQAFNETFNGEYMMTIAETARGYVRKKLAETQIGPDETINDIPVREIISILIDTIEIRIEDVDGSPVHVIGWFDDKSVKLAKLFEYGTQSGDTAKPAHPIIQNIMINEEKTGLAGIVTAMLEGIVDRILTKIGH